MTPYAKKLLIAKLKALAADWQKRADNLHGAGWQVGDTYELCAQELEELAKEYE